MESIGGERILVAEFESGVARPVCLRDSSFFLSSFVCRRLVGLDMLGLGLHVSNRVFSFPESSYSEPLLDYSEYS